MVIGLIGYAKLTTPAIPDYKGDGNGVTELVEIKPGSSVSALGPELVKRGIVESNAAFQQAAATNKKAATITPGFYKLQGRMSAASAVASLVDPSKKVQLLKVPNGATLEDVTVVGGGVRYGIYTKIAKLACPKGSAAKCVTVAQLESAAATVDPKELGVPDWAIDRVKARGDDPKRIEGLIAPGDYVVNPNSNAKQILTDLLTRSAATWDHTGIKDKAKKVGLSPYDLLVAASLVERESPPGEFAKVARVIVNRLAARMRLEFDSTVNYDLPSQEVATTDKDRQRVTPWNTYAKDGLPSTPIASPSLAALEAMENPAPGSWLFFVTVDKKGTTVFNDTFDEHLKDTQDAVKNGVLDSRRSPVAPPPPPPTQ